MGSRVRPETGSAVCYNTSWAQFSQQKDTGVDVRSHDVSGHVEVELDELSLQAEERRAAAKTAGKGRAWVREEPKTHSQSVRSCRS